ncbi:MAG: ribonuclease E [Alcanivorax sp.]|uniref:ribonuclease E n=1 Tax=Alloalcanivorax marinus TaxID=1177169 RepID=UPI00195B3CDA|nr:ribonuclease E [Alloalcanivorax marinus]MBM7333810.1 ribonuclease E [Alloalcanivorax marinus]
MKRMLINATHPEEIRVALVDGQRLYDLDIEHRTRVQKKANIYKGKITRIEPSLEAAFVDFGAERHGFLPLKEISRQYFQKDPKDIQGRINIKEVIKEGQEVIIQVDKEERGNKGAALTTFISLAGRYLVLMPNNPRAGGISRRIEGEERQQLKEALGSLQIPDEMGVIVRTAGLGRSAEELQWDLNYLLKLWGSIAEASETRKAPFLIYQESNVIIRAIRDYLRKDIGEVLIDSQKVYNEAQAFVQQVMTDFQHKIKLYSDDTPLFSRYQIESQIETAFEREVKLPSGGSIVIDPTEALVSIDINSSRATKGADIEETALQTNLEAADEIARQLRLRDIGGLIVVDFIDMGPARNQREVENRMRDALEADRARIQLGRISRFGLLELSRQRLRPSLGETSSIVCPRCDGLGHIRDVKSLALSILRLIEEEVMKERTGEIQAQVPVPVGTFLLNEKRQVLREIEANHKVRVLVIPNPHLETPHFEVERIRDDQTTDLVSHELELVEGHQDPAAQSAQDTEIKTQEPAVKLIAPDTAPPPPKPQAEKPEAAKPEQAAKSAKAAPAPTVQPTNFLARFFTWLAVLFNGTPEEQAARAKRRDQQNAKRQSGRDDKRGGQRDDRRRGGQNRAKGGNNRGDQKDNRQDNRNGQRDDKRGGPRDDQRKNARDDGNGDNGGRGRGRNRRGGRGGRGGNNGNGDNARDNSQRDNAQRDNAQRDNGQRDGKPSEPKTDKADAKGDNRADNRNDNKGGKAKSQDKPQDKGPRKDDGPKAQRRTDSRDDRPLRERQRPGKPEQAEGGDRPQPDNRGQADARPQDQDAGQVERAASQDAPGQPPRMTSEDNTPGRDQERGDSRPPRAKLVPAEEGAQSEAQPAAADDESRRKPTAGEQRARDTQAVETGQPEVKPEQAGTPADSAPPAAAPEVPVKAEQDARREAARSNPAAPAADAAPKQAEPKAKHEPEAPAPKSEAAEPKPEGNAPEPKAVEPEPKAAEPEPKATEPKPEAAQAEPKAADTAPQAPASEPAPSQPKAVEPEQKPAEPAPQAAQAQPKAPEAAPKAADEQSAPKVDADADQAPLDVTPANRDPAPAPSPAAEPAADGEPQRAGNDPRQRNPKAAPPRPAPAQPAAPAPAPESASEAPARPSFAKPAPAQIPAGRAGNDPRQRRREQQAAQTPDQGEDVNHDA